MNNVIIQRDLDISFGIDNVKTNINKIIPLGVYTLHSKNDTFNTFRISKMDGLEIVTFNITLKKIDDNTTNIKLDCIENIRNSGHEMVVNRIFDNFFDRLGKSLNGLSDAEIKVAANKGCFGIVLLLLLPLSLLLL